MANSEASQDGVTGSNLREVVAASPGNSSPSLVGSVMTAFASLRLTVTLFAFSIFLVFSGTLAQVDHDVWEVVHQGYFRVWFAWVEFQAFVRLLEMVYQGNWGEASGGFWFPGGMLLGAALAINLAAAHEKRFKVVAPKGQRTLGGLVIGLGLLAGAVLILGDQRGIVEGLFSPVVERILWHVFRAIAAATALAGAYWLALHYGATRRAVWWIALALVAMLGAVVLWLFSNPEIRLDSSGMRILWILSLCSLVAWVLFSGCLLLFGQRAGVVLLHGGVGLLMVGELLTGLTAEESQMAVAEGETVQFAYDIRSTELAVIDRSGKEIDRVTVVPSHLLAQAGNSIVSHEELPFDLRVVQFLDNSVLKFADSHDENLATHGEGVQWVALPARSVTGVASGGGVNLPSAYVELLDKQTGKSAGAYLISASTDVAQRGLPEQTVEVGNARYDIVLRFKRIYKPWSVTLVDFRFDRYQGTTVAKNFSSEIILRDPERNIERRTKIWMNNPARHAGDTLYQSSFDKATERISYLQVVTNQGRMLPYLSCALVAVGMLTHFGVALLRFVRHRAQEDVRLGRKAKTHSKFDWTAPRAFVPILVGVLVAFYLASKARPVADAPGEMPVERFGALPLAEGGRIKPHDSYARNVLQRLSGRQEAILQHGGRISAMRWMLDTIAAKPKSREEYRIFRVTNLEVLKALGLSPRPGSFRYTYDEIARNLEEFEKQIDLAMEVPSKERSLFQSEIVELNDKMGMFRMMVAAYGEPRIDPSPERVEVALRQAASLASRLQEMGAPRAAPPVEAAGLWSTLFRAELNDLFDQARQTPRNPATGAFSDAINAYRNGEIAPFTAALEKLESQLAEYQRRLQDPANASALEGLAPSERMNLAKARFEQFYSQTSPLYYCMVAYLLAFLLAALGWLGYPTILGRSTVAVLVIAVLVHTLAVVARVYISGRPPVTNLYSSAVFISWATVLIGLLLESVYRMGIGSVVASVLGFLTLLIAQNLAQDGDTFTVLVAVLDTQFWLATHVVCITLGYATTYLTGFLGAIYLLASLPLTKLNAKRQRQILRMVYGTLAFATFFSFVGTVLGGLWADDSWGRFWGWDPKENGALIIVLWNALVLHARWGGMVKTRGLAALAVLGNVVTSWSWFGVNELGVGLHNYGFREGVALWLAMFAGSQLLLASFALLPKRKAN